MQRCSKCNFYIYFCTFMLSFNLFFMFYICLKSHFERWNRAAYSRKNHLQRKIILHFLFNVFFFFYVVTEIPCCQLLVFVCHIDQKAFVKKIYYININTYKRAHALMKYSFDTYTVQNYCQHLYDEL